MKKFAKVGIFLFLVGQLINNAIAENLAPRDQMLTAEQTLADVALTRHALEDIHAGYDRYTERAVLDALWAELLSDSEEGMTRGQLYLRLSEILATIRCDHTKAEIPDDFEADRNVRPIYLPFRFKLFDDRMYVSEVAEGIPLTREDEILSIDGESVDTLARKVSQYFPVDGDTDYVKESSISDFGEFHGPAFEHFMPYLQDIASVAILSLRHKDGTEEEVIVKRLTFDDYSAITGEKRFSRNFADAVRYEPLGTDAAYLAVDTFVNYRKPVNPDKIYRPIFEKMSAEGRTKLILDLRQNGGGSNDAQQGLVRWIIKEPLQQAEAVWTLTNAIDEELKPYLSTWEKAALNPDPEWFEDIGKGYYKIVSRQAGAPDGPLIPKEDAFEGELVLLTSTDNASGVTHLLASFKAAGRGTFIGEPTGGSATGATAGIILFLNLPESGITVRVPLQRTIIANTAQFNPRLGVQPDILAADTKESFFAGKDPALDAAKRFLDIQE